MSWFIRWSMDAPITPNDNKPQWFNLVPVITGSRMQLIALFQVAYWTYNFTVSTTSTRSVFELSVFVKTYDKV